MTTSQTGVRQVKITAGGHTALLARNRVLKAFRHGSYTSLAAHAAKPGDLLYDSGDCGYESYEQAMQAGYIVELIPVQKVEYL